MQSEGGKGPTLAARGERRPADGWDNLAAIQWGKRYGKNCMDSFDQQTASAGLPLSERAANGHTRVGCVVPRAAQIGPAPRKRPPRVSLKGMAVLAEKERQLSSVNFLRDDDDGLPVRPRPSGARRARPASAPVRRGVQQPAAGGQPKAGGLRRPSSASVHSRSAPLTTVDELNRTTVRPNTMGTRRTERRHSIAAAGKVTCGTVSLRTHDRKGEHRSGALESPRGNTAWHSQIMAALDAIHGQPWTSRRLVCCAILDELADHAPQLGQVLRRLGGELGGEADEIEPDTVTETTVSSLRAQLKAAETKAAQALSAVAHHQRERASQRSKVQDLSSQLTRVQEELQACQSAMQQGPAAVTLQLQTDIAATATMDPPHRVDPSLPHHNPMVVQVLLGSASSVGDRVQL
jgi:hypothetical protein